MSGGDRLTMKPEQFSDTAYIGIGGCGRNMLKSWQAKLPDHAFRMAVDRDKRSFVQSNECEHRLLLGQVNSKGATAEYADSVRKEVQASVDKQVVTVLVMPFGFESERMKVAEYALPGFDGDANRLLCFNDYLIKHTPADTSLTDAFDIMNEKAFELLQMLE